jgi:hypothetical protein
VQVKQRELSNSLGGLVAVMIGIHGVVAKKRKFLSIMALWERQATAWAYSYDGESGDGSVTANRYCRVSSAKGTRSTEGGRR